MRKKYWLSCHQSVITKSVLQNPANDNCYTFEELIVSKTGATHHLSVSAEGFRLKLLTTWCVVLEEFIVSEAGATGRGLRWLHFPILALLCYLKVESFVVRVDRVLRTHLAAEIENSEWMNGWMNEWINEWMNEWMSDRVLRTHLAAENEKKTKMRK